MPLADLAEIPNTAVSLMVGSGHSQVLFRYLGEPFSTNIPTAKNVTLENNMSGMINGDFKGIELYANNDSYEAVDKLMNILQASGIMAIMSKV